MPTDLEYLMTLDMFFNEQVIQPKLAKLKTQNNQLISVSTEEFEVFFRDFFAKYPNQAVRMLIALHSENFANLLTKPQAARLSYLKKMMHADDQKVFWEKVLVSEEGYPKPYPSYYGSMRPHQFLPGMPEDLKHEITEVFSDPEFGAPNVDLFAERHPLKVILGDYCLMLFLDDQSKKPEISILELGAKEFQDVGCAAKLVALSRNELFNIHKKEFFTDEDMRQCFSLSKKLLSLVLLAAPHGSFGYALSSMICYAVANHYHQVMAVKYSIRAPGTVFFADAYKGKEVHISRAEKLVSLHLAYYELAVKTEPYSRAIFSNANHQRFFDNIYFNDSERSLESTYNDLTSEQYQRMWSEHFRGLRHEWNFKSDKTTKAKRVGSLSRS